jgi:hypothetical protein
VLVARLLLLGVAVAATTAAVVVVAVAVVVVLPRVETEGEDVVEVVGGGLVMLRRGAQKMQRSLRMARGQPIVCGPLAA